MDYDINYIEASYDAKELHDIFIQEFIPIGYTIKIEKVKNNSSHI